MKTLVPRRTVFTPVRELEAMQERMNRLFGRNFPNLATFQPFFPTNFTEETVEWIPAIDLRELTDEYILTAELPGMKKNEITVDLEENVLTLKGEKKAEIEEEGFEGKWHVFERRYGSFERSFTLPRSVIAEKIKADFDEGILTVYLPKSVEARGRHIEIAGKR